VEWEATPWLSFMIGGLAIFMFFRRKLKWKTEKVNLIYGN
jgi:hypothetical protein